MSTSVRQNACPVTLRWPAVRSSLWCTAGGIGLLAIHTSNLATPLGAEISSTATVVQPASVMESFSPSLPLMAADKSWNTLTIIPSISPGVQATGAVAAPGESTVRASAPAGVASTPGSAPVLATAALALPSTGFAAAGSSNLLKGPITAALQISPAMAGASPEAMSAIRFIVAFN